MNEYLKSVEDFHKNFNHPIEDKIKEDNLKLRELRLKLLFEEIVELSDGMATNKMLKNLCEEVINDKEVKEHDNYDKKETLDALGDIQYVLSGAVLSTGYKNVFDRAFNDIHQSNMSKMCSNSKEVKETMNHYREVKNEKLKMEVVPKNGKFAIVREDGKILKNLYYKEVELDKYIEEIT